MKKVIPFLLAALLLCGCGGAPSGSPSPTAGASVTQSPEITAPPAASEGQFVFTRENFPGLDGSTSMIPLGEAIACVLLGETRQEVQDLIRFNRTSQSFINLSEKLCDVVIAAEPSDELLTQLKYANIELQEIATDALVFVVNEDNPVDSLTREQVRRIYSGEITNWSAVGGDDLPITAFQRNSSSGSQVAMERVVMQDLEMMKAPAEYQIAEMGQLIEAVRNYDDSPGAIGYTVYYYANDMEMASGLKILAINDVSPGVETIRDGDYPFPVRCYAAILRSAEEGSPARILFDWLLSDDGQRLVASQGYVSIKDVQ